MIPRRRADTGADELADLEARCRGEPTDEPEAITRWEQAVADFVGVPHAVAVSSGRRGMTLILKHLGIETGDEIIIPAYTLGDLIPLLQGLGATVRPADIDPETLNVSLEALEGRINSKTKAIIALHTFGAPCRIRSITALARRRDLLVIEDCAHSLGASFEGAQTGSFGQAAFFSFEPTKPVNTFGGGMVVSDNESLINNIRSDLTDDVWDAGPVRSKIRATRTEHFLFSTGLALPALYMLASPWWKGAVSRTYRRFLHAPPVNIRYLPVQAEAGLARLPTLARRMGNRKTMAESLRSLLRPDIRTQRIEPACESSWYFFVAVLPCQAASVRRKLLLRGVDAGIENEIADDCAALLGYSDCPGIESVFRRAIALPMYDGISESAVRKVAHAVNTVVSKCLRKS